MLESIYHMKLKILKKTTQIIWCENVKTFPFHTTL